MIQFKKDLKRKHCQQSSPFDILICWPSTSQGAWCFSLPLWAKFGGTQPGHRVTKECPKITKPMSPLSLAHLISGSRPWFPDTRGRWMCFWVRESSDKRFGKKRVNDGESEGAVAVGREREMGTHMNTLNFFGMNQRQDPAWEIWALKCLCKLELVKSSCPPGSMKFCQFRTEYTKCGRHQKWQDCACTKCMKYSQNTQNACRENWLLASKPSQPTTHQNGEDLIRSRGDFFHHVASLEECTHSKIAFRSHAQRLMTEGRKDIEAGPFESGRSTGRFIEIDTTTRICETVRWLFLHVTFYKNIQSIGIHSYISKLCCTPHAQIESKNLRPAKDCPKVRR